MNGIKSQGSCMVPMTPKMGGSGHYFSYHRELDLEKFV